MEGNYFDNTTLLAELLKIARNSLYKAIKSGSVEKNEHGEILLDCPYIQNRMRLAGIPTVQHLYDMQADHNSKAPANKNGRPKKGAKKAKPQSKPKTVRATVAAVQAQAKAKIAKPPKTESDGEGGVMADVTLLARQKMEYEVELQKQKMKEGLIKLKKMNDEMIDRVEVKKIYRQTFQSVDTSIRNSQGTGVGEKFNRLASKLKDSTDRERVAGFNELYSKIVADILSTAYDTMLEQAKIKKGDLDDE